MVATIRSSAPAVEDGLHLGARDAPLREEPVAPDQRQLGQRGPDLLDPLARGGHRNEVRLGEVPVVLGLLLHTARGRGPRVLVEVPGLLDDRPAVVQDGRVPLDLEAGGTLDAAQRVHVLRLGTCAELLTAVRAQRQVHVAAHLPHLHAGFRDTERLDDLAQLTDVRLGDLGSALARALDRLGDDLDERDARAVVVEQRVRGAVDAAGGTADVRRLAGVLLHVGALDLHAEGLAVLQLYVEVTVEGDRLVVLGGLEVLRHVRIEVVLPGEAAPLGDLAVQRETDPDRGLDADGVDDRERAGQAEAGGAGLRVGVPTEFGRAAAEHLGPGAEFDMDLEAHDGVVRRQRVLVRHQVGRGGHG